MIRQHKVSEVIFPCVIDKSGKLHQPEDVWFEGKVRVAVSGNLCLMNGIDSTTTDHVSSRYRVLHLYSFAMVHTHWNIECPRSYATVHLAALWSITAKNTD